METIKILNRSSPAATTITDLYTVPAATSVVASTLTVCNQNVAKIKFRVSVAVGGAADAPKQYIYYDVELLGKNSFTFTIGFTLAATDVVRVYSDTANTSFNLFGVEVT